MCADTGPFGSELILTQIHKTGGMFGLGVGSRTDQAFVDGDSTSGGRGCFWWTWCAIVSSGIKTVLARRAYCTPGTTVTFWATVGQNPSVLGLGGLGIVS